MPETVKVELTREEADSLAQVASYMIATVKALGPEVRSGRDKLRDSLKDSSDA